MALSRQQMNEEEIIRTMSPNDLMTFGDEIQYFAVGRSALECIDHALQAAHKPSAEVKRILDLPCGHGRVLRYLRCAFPEAEITACDLMRDAVDFCASTFDAIPVNSHEDPAQIPLLPNTFDLIWVGSLLTHLDADRWKPFLQAFCTWLRPGGVLIFSTHGRETYRLMATGVYDFCLPYWRISLLLWEYERSGFGYVNYRAAGRYGVTLSDAAWVFRHIAQLRQMCLVYFGEKAWDNHQDIFACSRDPEWQVPSRSISVWTFLKHRLREVVKPRKISGFWNMFPPVW
ncbi:MAG TPA: class I SAM-dependent methyltransferase [Gemmataceae bacterium]|jgi:SAM-dependent methyltransferase|nr:class I SAM-dependent methyltransferase [Gemmataceae bacterium]